MENPKLTDLIDTSVLQKIQDAFSEFTGMAALITNEEGIPVTHGSGFSDFCMHFTRKSQIGKKRCEECDKMGALMTLKNGTSVVYRCHAGLVDYAVPIMLEEQFIGSFIGGQISTDPLDMEQIRQTAQELSLDEDGYVQAAMQILVKEESEVKRAAKFLYLLGTVLSEMAYKSNEELKKTHKLKRAAQSQAAFVMDMNREFQDSVWGWLDTAKKAVESGDSLNIENSIQQLLKKGPVLLSNLSDTIEYAKLTEGRLELNETEYNIEDLLRFVCHNIEEDLEDKAIVIIRQIDNNVPDRLLGDEGRIGQIISKILMNLIQYTQEGVIDIHVSSRKHGYAEDLTIEITNSGTEILPDQYSILKKYLETGDTDGFDKKKDEKNDFSMVSFLLKQMSGSIKVASTEKKGITFAIQLPQLSLVS